MIAGTGGSMRATMARAALGLVGCLLFTVSAFAQGGELVTAEWGVPGQRVDVTARVRSLVHNGVLNFEVTRFVLGIDPDPHRVKDLLIRVRSWDGRIEEYNYPERGVVNLELDPEDGYREDRWREEREHHDHDRDRDYDDDHRPRGLQIFRAYYGDDGQFINVTDALRSYIGADGRINILVNNMNMGGDPFPGHRKLLRVLYSFNGERRHVIVEEKTYLQLP
jgi:hypothetical protein